MQSHVRSPTPELFVEDRSISPGSDERKNLGAFAYPMPSLVVTVNDSMMAQGSHQTPATVAAKSLIITWTWFKPAGGSLGR